MRLTVIGCGHLGATHAACMASIGHEVLGVEIDDEKVAVLNSGKAWFHEPGLDEMLAANIEAGRLRFTTSFEDAARSANAHFIGVATPGKPDGSYDLSQLHSAGAALVPHLRGTHLIIGKSTVPPGTAAHLQSFANSQRTSPDAAVEVAWNPEFLRESCAVEDTLRPDRLVVGAVSDSAVEIIQEIYRPLTDAGIPMVVTDLATSELVKGAANAFLATKISFINAMADVCATTNGDITALSRALGMDPRIGPAFLKAGIGYGGACLPKDVRGLAAFAERSGVRNATVLLDAVDTVNASRSGQVVDIARAALGGIKGRRIAIWGAAFKPGTDDVRDSTGLKVAEQLRRLGATVIVYDPMATGNALMTFPELDYVDSASAAVADAELLLVVTAWPEFAQAAPAEVGGAMRHKAVVDACQGINSTDWREAGWDVRSLTTAPVRQMLSLSTTAIADGVPLAG